MTLRSVRDLISAMNLNLNEVENVVLPVLEDSINTFAKLIFRKSREENVKENKDKDTWPLRFHGFALFANAFNT